MFNWLRSFFLEEETKVKEAVSNLEEKIKQRTIDLVEHNALVNFYQNQKAKAERDIAAAKAELEKIKNL